MRAILIDPRTEKIAALEIPQYPDQQRVRDAISRQIGRATFYWITHDTMVAVCEEANGKAFFAITCSPPLYSRAVVIGRENDAFCDVPLPIEEIRRMVRWGLPEARQETQPAAGKKKKYAKRSPKDKGRSD